MQVGFYAFTPYSKFSNSDLGMNAEDVRRLTKSMSKDESADEKADQDQLSTEEKEDLSKENSESFEFETACVCCGGITRYKILPEEKWYKEIKKSIESGEDLRFIDICGFCVKEQTMTTKLNCINNVLYDENGKRK